jgi:hypothetical protein
MEGPSHEPGSSPVYSARGAPPRPLPESRELRPSWRGPLLVVFVMFGWMTVIFALAGIAAPNFKATPVPIGRGVVVTPAAGWYSASDLWDVGPDAVSLQKDGALVAFGVEAFSGGTPAFLASYSDWLRGQLGSYRALPTSSTTIDGDRTALRILFSGVANSSRIEGELVVATSAGTGIVMLARAHQGQLAGVQHDLDDMLRSLKVP